MEKKKRRSLHNILAMVFTFAMVMVFAGLVGKMDANAEENFCKVYVNVKDKNTQAIITNAKVIFTEYYRSAVSYTHLTLPTICSV